MRSLVSVIALAHLLMSVSCNTVPAQQPAGPATLEGLLNAEATQASAAAAEDEETGVSPKRPAGTVVRPKEGIQHPDLDKAWSEYDAAVAKVADSIKAAITNKFDAAVTKGDLDVAEKWQNLGERFEKSGELPAENETKATMNAAVADYKKAREELTKAYEAVMKNLTMEKKIADAKAVRGELRIITGATPGNVEASDRMPDRQMQPHLPPKVGKVVDLLELVDPRRDAVQGKWEKTPTGSLSFDNARGDVNGKLEIRLVPPATYDLFLDVEPKGGARQLVLYIPVDGASRFSFIKLPSGLPERQGGTAVFNVHLRVRGNQTAVAIDGQPTDCKFKDTASNSYWRLRNGELLGVGAWESSFVIHKAGLVEDRPARNVR